MSGSRPAALAFLLAALLLGPAPRPAAASPGELRVAAVQLHFTPADLASTAAYVSLIQEAVLRCLPFAPDLILFPEYASVFLALLPYGRLIQGAQSLDQALQRVLERANRWPTTWGSCSCSNSALTESSLRELFGGLARRHGVAIGAGTWFAPAQANGRTVLVDRAVIFDSSGAQLYTQDKVFLTPFEEGILGLRPGRLSDARPFLLKGRRLALTICRDTYSEEWDGRLAGAELWVDLKANGEPFTQAVRESFLHALPARLSETGVPFGLTVCLTGELAGLRWEGQSFVAGREPRGGCGSWRLPSPPSAGRSFSSSCLPPLPDASAPLHRAASRRLPPILAAGVFKGYSIYMKFKIAVLGLLLAAAVTGFADEKEGRGPAVSQAMTAASFASRTLSSQDLRRPDRPAQLLPGRRAHR